MLEINSISDLRNSIKILEEKQSEEGIILRQECSRIFNALKPINLIKNTLKEVVGSSEIKNNLLIGLTGIGLGHLSQKMISNESDSLIKKLTRGAVIYGISSIIVNHPEQIKLAGKMVFAYVGRLREKGNKESKIQE
jgi:hypothetical protein